MPSEGYEHKGYTGREMSRLDAWMQLHKALRNMEARAAQADHVVPFESLINNSDALRLHALGVRL